MNNTNKGPLAWRALSALGNGVKNLASDFTPYNVDPMTINTLGGTYNPTTNQQTFVQQSPAQTFVQQKPVQNFSPVPVKSPYASYPGDNINYSIPTSFNTDPINPTTTAGSALIQPVVNTPALGLPENMGGIKTGNIPIPGVSPFADPASSAATGFDWGKYFNKDTLGLGIDAITGVGSLLQGWSALKNAKLGKQQLAENRRMYDQNYAAQRTLTNNAIADQNAYKTAQGMSNLSNLVL